MLLHSLEKAARFHINAIAHEYFNVPDALFELILRINFLNIIFFFNY
jgi:hypothetical protein